MLVCVHIANMNYPEQTALKLLDQQGVENQSEPLARTNNKQCNGREKWRKRTNDEVKAILEMYSQGYGCKEIAQRVLGRSSASTSVRGVLLKSGIPLRTMQEGRRLIVLQGRLKGTKEKCPFKREAHKRKIKRQSKQKGLKEGLPLFESINAKERAIRKGYKSAYHFKYSEDPAFRMKEIVKGRFQKPVKGIGHGSARMMGLIGCSKEELRLWIESQFDETMSWDNHGQGTWHIDHVVPCSWFDQSNNDHLLMCWNFMNLRPLSASENLKKPSIKDGYIDNDSLLRLEALPDCDIKTKLIHFASTITNTITK